ncbi:origin recognition complex subunit 3 [Bacillus rossius redtenbacheri]|uniref:origin recognition complex subunit 3 n=1 Tax=Bacillus rossius redtenbacheri TaxID=93214 RepID=UPI002FDD4E36
MDSTLSVSKGCFVLKPERAAKHRQPGHQQQAWHRAFRACWRLVEDKTQAIHNTAFSEVLGHVVGYLKHCRSDPVLADVVPAVALLTGVSVPDHAALFAAVCTELREQVTPHVASLRGDDCRSLKAALERLVSQFISGGQDLDDTITELKVKKSKCTFAVLSAWYKSESVKLAESDALSTQVSPFRPGSIKDGHLLGNTPISRSSGFMSGTAGSVTIAGKQEVVTDEHLMGKLTSQSPLNSAKKLTSPFKLLYSPTRSPRKLMIAKKLLLQSPESSKTNTSSHLKSSSCSSRSKMSKKSKVYSPCKYERVAPPSKSQFKVQTLSTSLCRVKTDLFEAFGGADCSGSDDSPSERGAKSQKSPARSPGRPPCTERGSPRGFGRDVLSEYDIRESVVVLTPLKGDLTPSPRSRGDEGRGRRRRSCKRPAPAGRPESPDAKRRRSVHAAPSRARALGRKPPLVVVVPDFESFSPAVLQDLILIASGHVQELPLVFVFGVATTVAAVHRSLPQHVSSRVCLRVFQSRPSLGLLDQVVDQVVLCSECPFMLGGQTFQLLSDLFLCYDFSVQAFVQRLKFCMLEHFQRGGAELCCPPGQLREAVAALRHEDLDCLRGLGSFRRHVESRPHPEQAPLLTDDRLFRRELERLLRRLHKHVRLFHNALRCLHALTAALPRAPLGKNLRELYAVAVCSPVAETAQYAECRRMLQLQSREELEARLVAASTALAGRELGELAERLDRWVEQLQALGDAPARSPPATPASPLKSPARHHARSRLRQRIWEMARKERPPSAYERLRGQVLEGLMGEALPPLLAPPSSLPLHEVLLFDEPSVRRHLAPAPRAALHSALGDPRRYLLCECCRLPEPSAILQTMPDVCIAYKLHLESGRLVNLYDWLQAFVAVVSPGDGEESREVDPRLQARFTQAVSELQFLGFVKASKKKTDHVIRTTWGAC